MHEWYILKSVVEKRDKKYHISKKELNKLIINKTDVKIIKELLKSGNLTLKELRERIKRTRISIYFSLKKLESFGFIIKNGSMVSLSENNALNIFKKLVSEKFDFDYIIGERLDVLNSLMEWKSPDDISHKLGMSTSSVYKYINQLMPLLDKSKNRYRIKRDKRLLMEFVRFMRDDMKSKNKEFIEIWSHRDEMLIKTGKPFDGALTSFSRFHEFGVKINDDYMNFMYYFKPKKNLMPEEILVHSIKSSENKDMLSHSIAFFMKNKEIMNQLMIERLANKFDVMDLWMDIYSYITNNENIKNRDMFISKDEFRRRFGFECSVKKIGGNMKGDTDYSDEILLISKIVSLDLINVLECERLLREKKLNWSLIKRLIINELKESRNVPLEPILFRMDAISKRTGVEIPIMKDISRAITEDKILEFVKEKRTVKDIQKYLQIPEYQVRNILNKMSKDNRVKKLNTKPVTYILLS